MAHLYGIFLAQNTNGDTTTMLTLNTPWKDATFGSLYGDWDEASFMLQFDELIITKQDDDTFNCYGLLEHSSGITNKFVELKKGQVPYPVKFTLHNKEYKVRNKKGDEWVDVTNQPTMFERLVIAAIKTNETHYLASGKALAGKLQVAISPMLVQIWEHNQKNPDKDYPVSIAAILEQYPLIDLETCSIDLLKPYLSEIQKTSTESNGTKKTYQQPVDKLKKFKEIYSEYTEKPLNEVTLLNIRAELLSWLDDASPDYDIFLKITEMILK